VTGQPSPPVLDLSQDVEHAVGVATLTRQRVGQAAAVAGQVVAECSQHALELDSIADDLAAAGEVQTARGLRLAAARIRSTADAARESSRGQHD
jgi:hypothetical protein